MPPNGELLPPSRWLPGHRSVKARLDVMVTVGKPVWLHLGLLGWCHGGGPGHGAPMGWRPRGRASWRCPGRRPKD